MIELLFGDTLYGLILLLGLVTFFTRFAGHLVLSRFGSIHPRVEVALQAVPAAVISTLVFPPALSKGPIEAATILLVGLLCLRFSPILVLVFGLGFLVAGRSIFAL